jgi:hypothetical protein
MEENLPDFERKERKKRRRKEEEKGKRRNEEPPQFIRLYECITLSSKMLRLVGHLFSEVLRASAAALTNFSALGKIPSLLLASLCSFQKQLTQR